MPWASIHTSGAGDGPAPRYERSEALANKVISSYVAMLGEVPELASVISSDLGIKPPRATLLEAWKVLRKRAYGNPERQARAFRGRIAGRGLYESLTERYEAGKIPQNIVTSELSRLAYGLADHFITRDWQKGPDYACSRHKIDPTFDRTEALVRLAAKLMKEKTLKLRAIESDLANRQKAEAERKSVQPRLF